MAKTTRITLELPVGEAVFPHLQEIEVYQPVDDNGKPRGEAKRRFITKVRYDQATRQAVKETLLAAAKKIMGVEFDPEVKLPFKKMKVKDSEGKVTGFEYLLEAKANEDHRPLIVDAKRQSIPVTQAIASGSKIKLGVTVSYYKGFGGGINLYLEGVQVIELVEGRTKFAFSSDEEGYEAEHNEDAKAGLFSATDSSEGSSEKADYNF